MTCIDYLHDTIKKLSFKRPRHGRRSVGFYVLNVAYTQGVPGGGLRNLRVKARCAKAIAMTFK